MTQLLALMQPAPEHLIANLHANMLATVVRAAAFIAEMLAARLLLLTLALAEELAIVLLAALDRLALAATSTRHLDRSLARRTLSRVTFRLAEMHRRLGMSRVADENPLAFLVTARDRIGARGADYFL